MQKKYSRLLHKLIKSNNYSERMKLKDYALLLFIFIIHTVK